MNEDVFNTSIRKFLKTLGVTAQREIEKAVRQALAEGKLKGNENFPPRLRSRSPGSGSRTRSREKSSWNDAAARASPAPHGRGINPGSPR